MKIAVPYAEEEIFQHFGHTPAFKIYEVRAGEILSEEVMDVCGSGHSALAHMLAQQEVNLLICGGVGGCARTAMAEAGIVVMGGVRGYADEAVDAFLAGNLCCDPNATCSHHDHNHSCSGHCRT